MSARNNVVWRCVAAVVMAIGGLAVIGAAPAAANNNGSWSVQPTGSNGVTPRDWFEYRLRPGQKITDLVSVSNLTDQDMTFALYPADAYNTPLDGAFALNLQKDPSHDEGTWIHLGYNAYTVPAHTRADFPFEIDVPADAAPGDHAAGIVAEDTTPLPPSQQGQGVNVQRRVGTRVYIRVEGPLQPQLSVTQVGEKHTQALLPPFTGRGHAAIAYQITNTGNTRIDGAKATLRIKDFMGRTLKTFPSVDLPELLPKGSVVFSNDLSSLPIIDRLNAEVTVTAPGIKTVRSKSFWVIPWVYVAIVVAILLAIWLWRRRRRKQDEPVDEKPTPDDSSNKEPALV